MPLAPRIATGVLLAATLWGAAAARQEPAAPQQSQTPAPAPPERQRKFVGEGTGGKTLEIAAGPGSIIGKDELILKEYVDIKYGDTRVQADYVRYVPSTKDVTALGNVILDEGTSRLTAEKLTYNLDTETGVFYSARGYAEPSYYFEAERVEKISKDEMVLYTATFTACTQPVPYWSFKIERALIRQDNYAYLHNARFKLGHVVVFYSPYLVWPVKAERASGLLFPEFGFSRRSGTILSNAIYWAIRRNMDATFYIDYMSLSGWGNGLEYRYMPSESGRGYFTGYFIRDQVAKEENLPGVSTDRWVINYGHNQFFGDGWKLVATANLVSDFNYYRDFERDLRLSTNPQAVSDLFLTRTWGFYSLNIRGERREQLVTATVPPTLGSPFFQTEEETITRYIAPGIELRGRRQRLGPLPIFLTLDSSADYFDKGTPDAQYGRLDVFPVFSSQLSPVPWLDVDASFGVRDTRYSRSQRTDLGCDNIPGTHDFGEGNGVPDAESDQNGNGIFDAADDIGCGGTAPGSFGARNGVWDHEQTVIVDEPIDRRVYQGGLTLIGPKFSRVFDRPDSTFSPQYKNTIEPQLRYTYQSRATTPGNIIQFDQIDAIGGNMNTLTYSVVTRLFAKRPVGGMQEMGALFGPPNSTFVSGGSMDPYARTREVLRRQQQEQQAAGGSAEAKAEEEEQKKRLSTVEIASLEISQDYSFLGPLSVSAALGSLFAPVQSNFGPINATLRYNPSLHTSIDMRSSYDILFRQIRQASLSANLRSLQHGFLDVTWSSVHDLESQALFEQGLGFPQPFNRSQIGVQGETSFWGHKLLFGMQTNYELGDIQEGEPRLRDQRYRFGYNTQCCGFQLELLNRNFEGSSQREVRFLINLKGIGNVLDFQSGSSGALPGTYPGIVP